MSLIHTESFTAFQQWTGDDAFNVNNTNMRKGFTNALKRAGYYAADSGHGTLQESGAWIVRPDPVYPDRAALVYSSGNTLNANRGAAFVFGAGIRKPLGSQGRPIIGGFSLFVPSEYVPAPLANGLPAVLFVLGNTISEGTGISVASATTALFAITTDLGISPFSGVKQSTKTIIPGRIAYLEYRVVDNEIRVWLDDVLVLQTALSVPPEVISINIYQPTVSAPTTFMQGLAGRWAISNWYNLTEDAQYPNVRLGPTTRVIGVRPGADIEADFQRPADATSNWQVASQDLVENPLMSLQSSTVGDQDVYAATKDSATSSGKMIHAVATKVLASNLESAPHSIRPLVMSVAGVEKEDPRPREFRRLDNNQFGTRVMYGVAQRPTDGKIFAVGTGVCVYATPSNGSAVSPFTSVFDEGATTIAYAVGFRTDGVGVIARSDGKLQVIQPNTDVPSAPFSVTTPTQVPRSMIVLPDNTILIGTTLGKFWRCLPGVDPTLAANWLLMATPVTASVDAIVYSPALNRLVAQIASNASFITSDDKGTTWIARVHGGGSTPQGNYVQLSFDGNAFSFILQNTTTANYVRRSTDGIVWTSPGYNTNGSTQGVIRFAFGNDGVIVAMNDGSTTTLTSFDGGTTWRRNSPLPNTIYGAGVMQNGDWIMMGAAGVMVGYTSALIDTPLMPLAGYQAAYNASATNPDTGLPWTPAEAAAAKFGMRITS